jgi:2,3-dihydro-2,3-dihydroxybenzoate dehydrogenase
MTTELDANTLPAQLADRVVLVVGAAGGIGMACVRAFADTGARVAAADVQPSPLAALVSQGAGRITAHSVDVADAGSVVRLIEDVETAHGGLDVLVNAAGVLRPASLLDTTVEDWDRAFDVNARGTFLLAQTAARSFVRRRAAGRIIVYASIVARIARPNNVAYCASKAAVVQAARCMALELAPMGITVNVVSPGSTATAMLLGTQMGGNPQARDTVIHGDLAGWRLGVPMGRLAEAEDQAAAAVFLAGPLAGHITGHELIVDGGQSLV